MIVFRKDGNATGVCWIKMYTYLKSEKYLWTVGFYTPDGKWNPVSDHRLETMAKDRVVYLNNGNG